MAWNSAAARYSDGVLYATRWPGHPGDLSPGELIPLGPVVRLGPYSLTLREDLELRFHVERADSVSAIYRLNERKGEWVYYDSVVDGMFVSTTAKRPGVYSVLDDRHGPRIRKPFMAERISYASSASVPEIVIPIEDTGSGVDDDRTVVYVDGIKQIARWDSPSKKMFILLADQNIIGRRAMSVVAYDKIGNRSQRDDVIDIGP